VPMRCGLHNQTRPAGSATSACHPKEVGADLQNFEGVAHKARG
jgi:hypothetical protein